MADFVELGIEGVDKLVDKHFHKIPDKALQSHTYNPREIRRRHRRRRQDPSPSSSESEVESTPPMSQDPRQSTAPPPPEYTYLPYSRDQPRLRPEYAPSPPLIGQQYFPPPPQSQWQPQQWDSSQGHGQALERRYSGDSDDDGYYSDRRHSRRPKAITRRSSSYHGPRGQDNYGDDDRQLVQSRRRRDSRDGSDMASKSKDVAHRYGVKEEVEGFFTKSPAGITGGVAGALIGGWAAKKAQVATGREGHHGTNPLLTLLGAAVGGLAVNAVVDKLEDRKKETAVKEAAWEEKWGSEDERDERRGRRDSGHSRGGRRQRSRSYS